MRSSWLNPQSVCSPIERYDLSKDCCNVDGPDEDGMTVRFEGLTKSPSGVTSSSVNASRRCSSSCSSPGVLYTLGIGEDRWELCGRSEAHFLFFAFAFESPFEDRLKGGSTTESVYEFLSGFGAAVYRLIEETGDVLSFAFEWGRGIGFWRNWGSSLRGNSTKVSGEPDFCFFCQRGCFCCFL
jgi:hypothetical protein